MSLRFTYRDGRFAVVGPADQVHLGTVHVRTAAGKVKTETVISVSPQFPDDDGTPLRLGFLSPLPGSRMRWPAARVTNPKASARSAAG